MSMSCVQAPANGKLPALFLLDSISKNAKEPFIQIFSRNLPEVCLRADGREATRGASLLHSRSCPSGCLGTVFMSYLVMLCMQLMHIYTSEQSSATLCCSCSVP
jgi:hypothetical protein